MFRVPSITIFFAMFDDAWHSIATYNLLDGPNWYNYECVLYFYICGPTWDSLLCRNF
jgi:hypothetical protein